MASRRWRLQGSQDESGTFKLLPITTEHEHHVSAMSEHGGRSRCGPGDLAVIAGQLGRTARGPDRRRRALPFRLPGGDRVGAVLSAGKPNPTLLYLTCPTLARSSAARGSRRSEATSSDLVPGRRRVCAALLDEVTASIESGAPTAPSVWPPSTAIARPEAGIGGPEDPEKASCLHAYAAALLAVMLRLAGRCRTRPETVDAGEDGLGRRLLPRWAEEGVVHRPPLRQVAGGREGAAIDVGTISVRLLVADVVDGRPVALVRRAEVTRLGEGLRPGGPSERGGAGAHGRGGGEFVDEARRQGADAVLLAGTSAAARRPTGRSSSEAWLEEHDLERPGAQRARGGRTCLRGRLPGRGRTPVVLDVGGGSTELITRLASGARRIGESGAGGEQGHREMDQDRPAAAGELDEVAREAAREFAKLREPLRRRRAGAGARRLVGVAGTVTTLACAGRRLEKYDGEVIHLRPHSGRGVRTAGRAGQA